MEKDVEDAGDLGSSLGMPLLACAGALEGRKTSGVEEGMATEEAASEEAGMLGAELDAIDLALLAFATDCADEPTLLTETVLLTATALLEDERRLLEMTGRGLLLGMADDVLVAEGGLLALDAVELWTEDVAEEEETPGAQAGLQAASPHFTTFRS